MSRKRPFSNITNNIDEKTYVLDANAVKKVNLDLQEDKDVNRIQVYVRIRPENEKESSSTNIKSVLYVVDNKNMIFDPREDGLNTYFYHGKVFKEVGKKPNKNLSFSFDQVFNTNSTNQQVFEVTTKGLINSLLEGCNCTVFAYGATGSGKTHTIIGNEREPGVIYLTVMELFSKIKDSNELEISISYLEIYNENVYDLLAPTTGKSLAVREDCKRGVVVANLSTHYPEDANHLINMIKIGNNNRAKQATNANSQSSRSHAIFQIFIEKHDYSSPHTMSIQLSKMSLIDLAGSERASVAYKGKRSQSLQREGSNINKSLLSLGNCINALAIKKGNKSQYVPYRNSKLTLLLRDSLNGNCRTAMIAAISPTNICFEDTHNTLSYANRAMGISFNYKPSTMKINSKDNKNREVLDAENQRLKQEVEKLKHDLKVLNESKNYLPFTKKLELLSLFDKRFELRKKYLEYESNIKKCTLRRMFKKAFYESSMELSTEQDFNLESNLDLKSIEDEISYYENLKNEHELKMNENQSLIDDCVDSIKLKLPDQDVLKEFLNLKQLEYDLKEEKYINKLSVEINKLVLSYYNHYESFKKETISLIKYLNSSYNDSEMQTRLFNLKKVVEEH